MTVSAMYKQKIRIDDDEYSETIRDSDDSLHAGHLSICLFNFAHLGFECARSRVLTFLMSSRVA